MDNSQSTKSLSPSTPYVNVFDEESVEKMMEGVQDEPSKELPFEEMELHQADRSASLSGITSEEEQFIENRTENVVPLTEGTEFGRGIGIYASCHGEIPDPSKHREIPDGLTFMKKNMSECGFASYKLKRQPTMQFDTIARRLEESFDPAFTAEECEAYGSWHNKDSDGKPLGANKKPIRVNTLTCPEFNTTPSNQMKSFLYKKYSGESTSKRVRGVFVSFGGKMVNLFTVTMDELIDVFAIPKPTDRHSRLEEINSILTKIKKYIKHRDTRKYISTNFIIDIAILLDHVYDVSVVRFLDESCNGSRYFGPFLNPHAKTGVGGRKSHKRKRRKSKKLRK